MLGKYRNRCYIPQHFSRSPSRDIFPMRKILIHRSFRSWSSFLNKYLISSLALTAKAKVRRRKSIKWNTISSGERKYSKKHSRGRLPFNLKQSVSAYDRRVLCTQRNGSEKLIRHTSRTMPLAIVRNYRT